jgi:uncharacterized protein YjiK
MRTVNEKEMEQISRLFIHVVAGVVAQVVAEDWMVLGEESHTLVTGSENSISQPDTWFASAYRISLIAHDSSLTSHQHSLT